MMMKKRWISLYVENEVGVLAKISGLFSAKSYNLDSLTVGPTADETVSRVTIGVISDDATFEQIKKQLNRCIEVITVLDFTERDIHIREIMFVKIVNPNQEEKAEAARIAEVYGLKIIDYMKQGLLMESLAVQEENDKIVKILKQNFTKLEIVRGGSVAIERI